MMNLILMYVILLLTVINFIAVIFFSKIIKDLDNYISDLVSELTKYQSHTDGAFNGIWFNEESVKKMFWEHKHKYEFNDGVLYIKEPIVENAENVENISVCE